jgi:inosine-uridine nucleoside N-ribohydrolase
MRSLIIDTDGGIDDAVALWWALSRPEVEVVAVLATWGNVGADGAAANASRILTAAGRTDIPLALGASGPVGPAPLMNRAEHVHGEDGLGGTAAEWPADAPVSAEPAAELLARLTGERPGELDLVTVGPLSTVAAALRADPGTATRTRSLTVMGGSVAAGGNALPLAEANIAHDPVGAAEVVAAGWVGERRPLLVGLDVTARALLGPEDLAAAEAAGTTAGRFLVGPLHHYGGYYERSGQAPVGWSPCHDLVATIAAVDDALVTSAPTVPLAVDTGRSAAWGATVADFRPVPEADEVPAGFAPWRVALEADLDYFRAAFRALVAG